MNFFEQLQKLDIKQPGRWPLLFRALAVGLVLAVVSAGMVYFFVIKGNLPDLRAAEAKQQELWKVFDQKQRDAANLDAYKAQLAEIEQSFGALLRQLPGRTEVPNLLVDISQTGLAAGLQERLFEPGGEIVRDFYAELPIKIRLTGTYHEFGEFVSGIAALPRIVTLHDIQIGPVGGRGQRRGAGPTDQLQLDLRAKTYRYLEESELKAQEEKAAQAKGKNRKKKGAN